MLSHTREVDDAVQEALLRAWKQREHCRTPSAPEAWVAQIARREALRYAARTSRDASRRATLNDEQPDPGGSSRDRTVEAIDLRRALRPLSADDRKLLALRYVADLTQLQVAETLGIPEGTVKVRLHRLRRRLHERLTA